MRSVPLPFLSKITLLWTRAREPGPVSPVKVDSPLPFPWTQRGEIYNLREAISGKGYLKPKCRFYYAESRIPYFIPISRKRVVLSLALEDYLIHDYDENLYRDVPDEAYIPNLVLSRKTLLLSIFCYVLILRFIELWTIIAAVIVRLVFAAIAVIVTGSFYEGVHKMMEAIWIGAALGKVVWKINECFNFIQDKMVEFVMKRTMTGTFDYLKKSGIPRGQGIRLWNR